MLISGSLLLDDPTRVRDFQLNCPSRYTFLVLYFLVSLFPSSCNFRCYLIRAHFDVISSTTFLQVNMSASISGGEMHKTWYCRNDGERL
jgi:hypothetical protein